MKINKERYLAESKVIAKIRLLKKRLIKYRSRLSLNNRYDTSAVFNFDRGRMHALDEVRVDLNELIEEINKL